MHETDQEGQTQDLPDGLGGLDGRDQDGQDVVPEELAGKQESTQDDDQGHSGDQELAGGSWGTTGRLEGFSPGEISCINDRIDCARDGTTEHFSTGRRDKNCG